MPHSFTTFKRQPIIVLKTNESDERGFQFGKTKALAISAALGKVIDFANTGEVIPGTVTGGFRVKADSYKGKPMIVIQKSPDDRYPVQFQQAKAILVRDNAAAVVTFSSELNGEVIPGDITDKLYEDNCQRVTGA